MAKKKLKQAAGVLADTARAIGSALGKLSVQADELTTKAKKIHLPTKAEAKKMVSDLLTPSKKKVAAKKPAVKPVVKKVAKKK